MLLPDWLTLTNAVPSRGWSDSHSTPKRRGERTAPPPIGVSTLQPLLIEITHTFDRRRSRLHSLYPPPKLSFPTPFSLASPLCPPPTTGNRRLYLLKLLAERRRLNLVRRLRRHLLYLRLCRPDELASNPVVGGAVLACGLLQLLFCTLGGKCRSDIICY